jgi:hypothetical protein
MSDGILPVQRDSRIPPHPGTTLFAVGWGLLASYQLLHGLFVTHSVRFMVVGPMALLMVWATLERKRWGRLALLGMSLTVLFVCLVGAQLADATGAAGLHATLDFFASSPGGLGAMLLLSVWTVFWMRRSVIVAEFEHGKHTGLVMGQRAIALTLVGLWGLMLILPSHASAHNDRKSQATAVTPPPFLYRDGPALPVSSNRIVRSAASASSR